MDRPRLLNLLLVCAIGFSLLGVATDSAAVPPDAAQPAPMVVHQPSTETNPLANTVPTWVARAPLPLPRAELGVVAASNGKIYATGGNIGDVGVQSQVDEYDPATDSWRGRAPLPFPRKRHAVAAGSNGKIYVFGGSSFRDPEGRESVVGSVQAYDPTTNTWSDRPSIPPLMFTKAVAASNGKIYQMGGSGPTGINGTVREYDPVAEQWTNCAPRPSCAPMPTPRRSHALAAASNGKIYAINGVYSGEAFTTIVEEYDPATNTWTNCAPRPSCAPTPTLGGPGDRTMDAVQAANGKIYFFVGWLSGPGFVGAVHEFDPVANTWAISPFLPSGRADMGATRASNGSIYVIGGYGPNGQVSIMGNEQMVLVPASSFGITAISPSTGGDTGLVTARIFGNGLQVGAAVRLVGPDLITGTNVSVALDGRSLTTTFDLNGRPRGIRDVVITNPGGALTSLAGAFTVVGGIPGSVWVNVVAPPLVRANSPDTIYIAYGNRGNVDLPLVTVWMAVPPAWAGSAPLDQAPTTIDQTDPAKTVLTLLVPVVEAGTSHVARLTLFPSNTAQSTRAAVAVPTVTPITGPIRQAARPVQSASNARNIYSSANPEQSVRDLLDAWGIGINNPNACPPGSSGVGCTSVGGLRQETLDCLRDFRFSSMLGDLQITGGNEHGSHRSDNDPYAQSHANGYKVDLNYFAPDNVHNSTLTDYIIDHNSRFTKIDDRIDKYTINGQDIYVSTPQWRDNSTHVIFAKETPPGKTTHWDVLFTPGCSGISDSGTGGPTEAQSRASQDVVAAFDPNGKVGLHGSGTLRYIRGDDDLSYAIFFENLPAATAPAQQVIITDQLDMAEMDLSTFNLGRIAFGDREVVPPPGTQLFSADVDLRPAKNLIVRINAGLDPITGVATWRFLSLDPLTGLPPTDPLAGFLPPDITPPAGEGSVFFTVKPRANLATGTAIRNWARIVFDTNTPIDTPEWLNTLDNTKPTSQVLPLAAVQASPGFPVTWSGADVGSGILDYTIFVSWEGAPYSLWLANTTASSGTFTASASGNYRFYSVARDQAGNREDPPLGPDATTQVLVPTLTPTPTPTATSTLTSAATVTSTPTATSTLTSAATVTSTPTVTSTLTSAATVTSTPTVTSTLTSAATVTSTPTRTGLIGDTNGDGIVDIRDYGIWRQNFGATDCSNIADVNSDCIVDIRDYGIWRQHFGETTGAASLGRGVPTTPTPATTPTSASSPTSPVSIMATPTGPATATPASAVMGTATATRTASSTPTATVTSRPSQTATVTATPIPAVGNVPLGKTPSSLPNQPNSEWQPVTEVRVFFGWLADEIRRNVTGAVGRGRGLAQGGSRLMGRSVLYNNSSTHYT